jgi:hypothetical protein
MSGGVAPPFLTSPLDGGEWSASRPGHFNLGKRPLYPLDRRLNRLQSRSERWGIEKNFLTMPGIELRLGFNPQCCYVSKRAFSFSFSVVLDLPNDSIALGFRPKLWIHLLFHALLYVCPVCSSYPP